MRGGSADCLSVTLPRRGSFALTRRNCARAFLDWVNDRKFFGERVLLLLWQEMGDTR